MFTRWEVAGPTTIENRAAASAAAINHPPINHCHLALRQPHAGPRGAPARSPPGMLGNEGWQRGWVGGGGGHPGVRLRAMLGRRRRCVMWGCACLFTLSRRSHAAQRPLSSGGKAGRAPGVEGLGGWGGVKMSGEVAARSSWRRRIWDYCWHVGWSELKTPQKYLLIACQSKGGSWTLKAFSFDFDRLVP